jgi:5-formyltetrahydrofolate cyclo-ligase
MGVHVSAIKSTLRQHFLARRGGISASDRARRAWQACAYLRAAGLAERAKALVGYTALGSEVDPSSALRHVARLQRPIYRPDWRDGGRRFVTISGDCALEGPGAGVVVLVPGVAFDTQGVRLGRGEGWYDRILRDYPEAFKIGLAFEEQITSSLPAEPWDVPMDLVVTDQRVLHPRAAFGTQRGMVPT